MAAQHLSSRRRGREGSLRRIYLLKILLVELVDNLDGGRGKKKKDIKDDSQMEA